MGLQISCSMDTEIQEEDALRTTSKGTGPHFEGTCYAERERDNRGAHEDGSHSRTHIRTAEISGCTGSRLHQGKERHMDRENIRTEEELHRSELLGQGILRINGRIG